MAAGIGGALLMPYAIKWGVASGVITETLPLYYFPILFIISIAGCIIGTYAAPATDEAVLKKFYSTVKPWGFWKPIHAMVVIDNPVFEANKRFKLDMFNVVLGIIAQLCLTLLPMYLVLWMKMPLLITTAILTGLIIILKRTWWDKLED